MQEEGKPKNNTTQKDSKAKKQTIRKLILLDVSSADTLTFKTVKNIIMYPMVKHNFLSGSKQTPTIQLLYFTI